MAEPLFVLILGVALGVVIASVYWAGIVAQRNQQIDSLRTQLWDEVINSPDRYGP